MTSTGPPLPSSFDEDEDFYNDSTSSKILRRLREEPLVPLGCALTVLALVGASRAMRAGDHNRTNTMFRRRIYAQGFTIAAIVAGSAYWGGDRKKRKELAETEKEKKRLERRERWLAELEARDKEEKDLKEKIKERLAKGKGSAVRKLDDTPTTETAGPSISKLVNPSGEQSGGGILSSVKGLWASNNDKD